MTTPLTPYERGQAAARAGERGPSFVWPSPDTSWTERLWARGYRDEMDKIVKERQQ